MRAQSAAPVADVAGAETVVRSAWRAPPAAWADLVCLRSAPTIWLPGVQQTLAEAAMSKAVARHALQGVEVDVSIQKEGRYVTAFRAQTSDKTDADEPWMVHGAHHLGFCAPDDAPLLCTFTCAGSTGCASSVEQMAFVGLRPGPPASGWWFQGLVSAARRPVFSVGLLVALVIAFTACLLQRRRHQRRRDVP